MSLECKESFTYLKVLVYTGFLFNCKKLSGSNIVFLYILE